MMIWIHARSVIAWFWHSVRAWFEVGRRLVQIEAELQDQASINRQEIERLQAAIASVAESERTGFEQVRSRLETLERKQNDQVASLDRALQERVDEWARQLSGQMNQLYAAIASNPVELRKR